MGTNDRKTQRTASGMERTPTFRLSIGMVISGFAIDNRSGGAAYGVDVGRRRIYDDDVERGITRDKS